MKQLKKNKKKKKKQDIRLLWCTLKIISCFYLACLCLFDKRRYYFCSATCSAKKKSVPVLFDKLDAEACVMEEKQKLKTSIKSHRSQTGITPDATVRAKMNTIISITLLLLVTGKRLAPFTEFLKKLNIKKT